MWLRVRPPATVKKKKKIHYGKQWGKKKLKEKDKKKKINKTPQSALIWCKYYCKFMFYRQSNHECLNKLRILIVINTKEFLVQSECDLNKQDSWTVLLLNNFSTVLKISSSLPGTLDGYFSVHVKSIKMFHYSIKKGYFI